MKLGIISYDFLNCIVDPNLVYCCYIFSFRLNAEIKFMKKKIKM